MFVNRLVGLVWSINVEVNITQNSGTKKNPPQQKKKTQIKINLKKHLHLVHTLQMYPVNLYSSLCDDSSPQLFFQFDRLYNGLGSTTMG